MANSVPTVRLRPKFVGSRDRYFYLRLLRKVSALNQSRVQLAVDFEAELLCLSKLLGHLPEKLIGIIRDGGWFFRTATTCQTQQQEINDKIKVQWTGPAAKRLLMRLRVFFHKGLSHVFKSLINSASAVYGFPKGKRHARSGIAMRAIFPLALLCSSGHAVCQ
jgi:hypothetical protein